MAVELKKNPFLLQRGPQLMVAISNHLNQLVQSYYSVVI
jgi:hypothetical protein